MWDSIGGVFWERGLGDVFINYVSCVFREFYIFASVWCGICVCVMSGGALGVG